ncbi:hypothetical protein [Anaerosporobacter sp.]
MEQVIRVKPYTKEKFDVNENGDYFVLSFSSTINFKVTDVAEFIISQFDGRRDVEEVLQVINDEGVQLEKDELNKFIDKFLIQNNLVEGMEFDTNNDSSKLWYHFPLFDGTRIKPIFNFFKVLFDQKMFIIQLAMFIVIQLFFWTTGRYFAETDKIWNNNTFVVLIVLFISSIYHELGHATAACYYNCKVGAIGVGLYLFKPVLYTDLSSTWKLSRKRRVIVDMGGIYFQLVMINAISLILLFINSSELKVAVLSIIVLAILNLNPFLRLDGYWILTDWLGIVNVNSRVFSLIKNKFSKYVLKRDYDEDNLELKPVTRAILYGYMFIYLLFTVVALVFGMYMIVQLVTGEVDLYALFLDLVRALKAGSFNTLFPAFNKLIIQSLPYVYIAIMIISLIRNVKKKKKANT